MTTRLIDEKTSIFEDVVKSLQENSELGAWIPAQRIGLECGFDRAVASRHVQKHLKNLVNMGLAEEERSDSPIVYRWKKWEKL